MTFVLVWVTQDVGGLAMLGVGWVCCMGVATILYTALVMRVFVIIPAAGIGTRMAAGGASTAAPKQFLEVSGVPVLIRSVRAFLAVPRVDAVCVAVRAKERARMEA